MLPRAFENSAMRFGRMARRHRQRPRFRRIRWCSNPAGRWQIDHGGAG